MKMRQFQNLKLFTLLMGILIGVASVAKASELSTKAPIKGSTQLASNTMSLPAAGASVTQIKNDDAEKKNGIGIAAGLEYSQKNAVDEKSSRENDFNLTLIPSYKFNETYSISAKGVLSQQNYGPKNTTYSNTKITLGIAGFKLNDYFTTAHTVGGVVPTSEETRKTDRYQGAVSIQNGFSFDSSIVKLSYLLGLSRSFHEYEFNAEGVSNVEYTLSHAIEANLIITETFYLSSGVVYKTGRTYGGKEKISFAIDGDINYNVTKNLGLNIGTSNDGAALKANGVDSNIAAYNENTSVVRAGIAYAY